MVLLIIIPHIQFIVLMLGNDDVIVTCGVLEVNKLAIFKDKLRKI